MRKLLAGLAAGTMLLACQAVPVVPADEPAPPTASEIEDSLRRSLAEDERGPWAEPRRRSAELKGLELLALDPLTPTRWYADVAVLFDYGARPPDVIGFERQRLGTYQVLLERVDDDWVVRRFYPLFKAKPLPGVG